MTTHSFEITGMTCEHCVRTVKNALAAVAGVESAEVRVGHADIEASDDTAAEALIAAIEAEKFQVRRT